jgi:hypothetical protein
MKNKLKTYCVHVYPAMIDYESIKAKSPEDAEDKVLRTEWPMHNQVDHVEVMRQCDCGQDNDLDNKKCDSCGKKL